MMNRLTPRCPSALRAVVLLAVVAGATSLAAAQPARPDERLVPPTPPAASTNWSPLMSMLVGIVISGLVLGVAFIPSKRGHQD